MLRSSPGLLAALAIIAAACGCGGNPELVLPFEQPDGATRPAALLDGGRVELIANPTVLDAGASQNQPEPIPVLPIIDGSALPLRDGGDAHDEIQDIFSGPI